MSLDLMYEIASPFKVSKGEHMPFNYHLFYLV